MIDQESLAALDGLLWLRSGEAVAERLNLSQPTVSRHARRCLKLFEIDVRKLDGEWDLIGDEPLLAAERRVHQEARWRGHRPLRLEATYWSGPLLCNPVPEGWLLGLCNIVGIERNFDLLRQRVVDAWLAGLPDLPEPDDPDLTSFTLSHMPVHCVVQDNHPLLRASSLSFKDLQPYPSLALPEGAYPKVEAALKSVGLWSSPVRMKRYDRRRWEGQTEQQLTIGYATCLSLEVSGAGMRRLPLQLPFQSGEALVVRREFSTTETFARLKHTLVERLTVLAAHHPEISLSDSSGTGAAPQRPEP